MAELTAEFACARDENRDYVRIYVTPKGEDPRCYRLSKGGAETLQAEIAGCLGDERLTQALERIAYLRPAGDIKAATNLRSLVMQIEQIALSALSPNPGSKHE